VSTFLHAFVSDFATFAECIGTDCKKEMEIKNNVVHVVTWIPKSADIFWAPLRKKVFYSENSFSSCIVKVNVTIQVAGVLQSGVS
jgi:hypothetical protein